MWTPFSFSTTLGPDVSGGVTLQLTATTGADGMSTAQVFYDNVKITLGAAPAAQEITVKVDVSELAPGGVNIAWWNGAGFDEYPATDEGNGVWSYVLTSGAPANLSTGVLRTYKWHIYYTAGGDQFENMQLLPGGGGLEHDIFQDVPANEPINTDFANYLDRGVMPDGSNWTAKTYYFDSFRQPGITYTELILNATAGSTCTFDYSENGWDAFGGPGSTDNGDGTYTALVRPTVAFEYFWKVNGTGEDLTSCTNDGVQINTDNFNYANRIHNVDEAENDIFNTCPPPLGVDEFDTVNFNVYPNPAQNEWNIKTNGQDITSVQVFDILGKNVMSVTPNSESVQLDATALPAGLYFARLTSENGSKSVKLVKQ